MAKEEAQIQEDPQATIANLQAQVLLLQSLLAAQPAPAGPEGYLLVRSNISGHTSIQHPDLEHRGVRGDRAIAPFSEIVVPASWRDSPNLAEAARQGIVTVTEVDEPPLKLLTMPTIPADSPVLEPLHKAIAYDIAKNGADSDEGDIDSYPESTRKLLLSDVRRPRVGNQQRGGVDIGYMQDVYMPVIEEALALEEAWRNRTWVVDFLEERITQIRNLTSIRR
jgi:hypothetical protein